MKKIYILSSCNVYKEYNSMRLVAATTSVKKIKNIIIKQIKEEEMAYTRGNADPSLTKQIKMLREDWEKMDEKFVFDNLQYGYVAVVADGEIQ